MEKQEIDNGNGVMIDIGHIHDLWHLIEWLEEQEYTVFNPLTLTKVNAGEAVKEVWHQAHAMKNHIEEQARGLTPGDDPVEIGVQGGYRLTADMDPTGHSMSVQVWAPDEDRGPFRDMHVPLFSNH